MKQAGWARALVGLSVLIAWGSTVVQAPVTDVLPHPAGLARWVELAWVTRLDVRWTLTAAQVLLIGAWVLGRRPALAAGLSFLLMSVVAQVEASFLPQLASATHGKMLPYAVLAAYELGRGLPGGSTGRGIEAASGMVAAGYVLGGIAKLRADGLAWVDGPALALLAVERAHLPPLWLGPVREAFGAAPRLAGALLAFTFLVELGAVAFLVPRLRMLWAMLLVGMHLGIGALMSYFHPDWALATLGVALASRGHFGSGTGGTDCR